MKKAKVYIIGAGPGDPELITLRGLRRLKEAEVVLYDFLASKELLRHVKKSARVICVGKADGMHLKEQEEINKLMAGFVSKGKNVARLKGGDPFVFSRGIEEALYLKSKGISFEVIPGVTSAFAACASFGIPLTRRGRISSVAVLTGHKSNGGPIDTPACDTLVYLMAVSTAGAVVDALIKSGKDIRTPCAFIERATTPSQRIITGTLGSILSRAKKSAVRAPAVFVAGEAVNYYRRLHAGKTFSR